MPDLTAFEQVQYIAEPLQKLGRTDDLVALADGLAGQPGLTARDLRAVSSVYSMAERPEAAASALQKALEAAGANPDEVGRTRAALAGLHESQGRLAEAAEQYTLAAEAGVDSAQYWDNAILAAKAASILARAGAGENADRAVGLALERGATSGEAHYEASIACRDLGDWQRAAELCRKALELEPDGHFRNAAAKLLEEAKARGF